MRHSIVQGSHAKLEIRLATPDDLEGIMVLQAANQVVNGGWLSANLPAEQILEMMKEMPLIVVSQEESIVGFLMTSSKEMGAKIPVIKAMLDVWSGSEEAYVYGPICVAETVRGRRLAHAMFLKLQHHLPGREGILFVRSDNAASLSAHRRMKMREVATYPFNDTIHHVFSTCSE